MNTEYTHAYIRVLISLSSEKPPRFPRGWLSRSRAVENINCRQQKNHKKTRRNPQRLSIRGRTLPPRCRYTCTQAAPQNVNVRRSLLLPRLKVGLRCTVRHDFHVEGRRRRGEQVHTPFFAWEGETTKKAQTLPPREPKKEEDKKKNKKCALPSPLSFAPERLAGHGRGGSPLATKPDFWPRGCPRATLCPTPDREGSPPPVSVHFAFFRRSQPVEGRTGAGVEGRKGI